MSKRNKHLQHPWMDSFLCFTCAERCLFLLDLYSQRVHMSLSDCNWFFSIFFFIYFCHSLTDKLLIIEDRWFWNVINIAFNVFSAVESDICPEDRSRQKRSKVDPVAGEKSRERSDDNLRGHFKLTYQWFTST